MRIINVRKEDNGDSSDSISAHGKDSPEADRKNSKKFYCKRYSNSQKKMNTGLSLAVAEYGNSFQWGSTIDLNNYLITNNQRPNLNLSEFIAINNVARCLTYDNYKNKKAVRWQSIEDNSQKAKPKPLSDLQKIGIKYKVVAFLNASKYGETYLIKIFSDPKEEQVEETKNE